MAVLIRSIGICTPITPVERDLDGLSFNAESGSHQMGCFPGDNHSVVAGTGVGIAAVNDQCLG